MQKTVQAQSVGIERVRRELTGELAEFLLDVLRHTHIKNALHQRFDGKQVRVDVFQISHCLLKGIGRFINTATGGGMHLTFSGARAMLLLQVFQHPTRESAERLKRSPTQLLLLTQSWILTNEPIVLPLEALTVRTLTRLFWHRQPVAQAPS